MDIQKANVTTNSAFAQRFFCRPSMTERFLFLMLYARKAEGMPELGAANAQRPA